MSKKNEVITMESNTNDFQSLVINAQEESFNIGETVVKDKALTTYHARASLLVKARAISEKALVIEIARLYSFKENLESINYKSVARFVADTFGTELDANTISRYIRIGRIFGDTSKNDVYLWKAPISQAVSITNLGQVLSLVIPNGVKLDDLTDTEINEYFDNFVNTYNPDFCVSADTVALLHLQGTNAKLRKEIAELKKESEAIPAKATEIEGADETGTTPETETETETESTAKDDYIIILNDILAKYRDNAEIETHVLALIDLLK